MLTLDSRLRIPSHVTTSFVDEDAVLLNTRTNQYFAMQDVSSRIWQLLKDGKGLRNVSQILQSEYAAELSEMEKDVLELVHELMENGLVELDEG
jgi:hypothetical protein